MQLRIMAKDQGDVTRSDQVRLQGGRCQGRRVSHIKFLSYLRCRVIHWLLPFAGSDSESFALHEIDNVLTKSWLTGKTEHEFSLSGKKSWHYRLPPVKTASKHIISRAASRQKRFLRTRSRPSYTWPVTLGFHKTQSVAIINCTTGSAEKRKCWAFASRHLAAHS